jgi:hypothetical protein
MKNASTSAQTPQSNKSGDEHCDPVEQQSYASSGSASVNRRQSGTKFMDVVCGPSNHSVGKEQKKIQNSKKTRQSTSNKSMKPQNVPWFRQWQEKAAATRGTCAIDLLPREERSAKLGELVTELKKKQEEELKMDLARSSFINKPDGPQNLKVIQPGNKKKVSRKPLRPDFLVNGKLYRPRLRRPKSWATPRLYKLIILKCEKKYGLIRARRKAEEFVIFLCEKVCNVSHYCQYNCYNYCYCYWNTEAQECGHRSVPLAPIMSQLIPILVFTVCVQTGSGASSASCPGLTRGFFP